MLAAAAAYLELVKPRFIMLVILSAMVGFYLGSGPAVNVGLFLKAAFGISLVSAGSMVLNQWVEREADALMTRTRGRPIPSGRISPRAALIFGLGISVAGLWLLAVKVNPGCSLLAGLTLLSYALVYTPLKMQTPLCTLVGAVPGALPPVAGWAAAEWPLPVEAWILFAILFFWQMPHFFAIGWIWRDDYRRAGFKILTVTDKSGREVASQIVLYSLALYPISLLPVLLGMSGMVYFTGALILGFAFVGAGLISARNLNQKAPFLFKMSILYLTAILILLVVDKA